MFNTSNDRVGLCTFTFDDGRHCNMPHTQSELRLCYFHEKRERQRLLTLDAGVKISRYLATNLHTACDLNGAFAMLFRAGAQGYLDAKLINALTRVGHLVLKTHLLAKEEYLDSYENEWRDIVLQSIALRPDPEPVPDHSANSNSRDSKPRTILPTNQEPPIDELNLMQPSMETHFPKDPAPDPSSGFPPLSGADDVAAGLSRRPSGQPTSEDVLEEEELEQTEEQPSMRPTTAPEDPTDDPFDPLPPDHGTRLPTNQRELLRYLRYLQRHSNRPQPGVTSCRMNRFKSPTKQTTYATHNSFKMNTFLNSTQRVPRLSRVRV